jgi:hypothetical protein
MTRREAAALARAAKAAKGKPTWNKGLKGDQRQCIPHVGLRGRDPWNKGMKFGPKAGAKGRDPEKARQRALRYSRSERGKERAKQSRLGGNWARAMEKAAWQCEICRDAATRVHHRDGRGGGLCKASRNDDLGNLIALCESCHRRIHIVLRRGENLPAGVHL